jgi:hypothetical protein
MKSTIALFVLVFALLGLFLGYAASFDIERQSLPENIEDRNPAIQQKLFEDCIKDQRFDGELTQDEYSSAYSIYG